MRRSWPPGCSPRRIRDHGRSLKKAPQSVENAFGQNSTCPTPKGRQEQRLRVLESSASLASENAHLRGAAHDCVFGSDRQEANRVAESRRNGICPRLKFGACPFKAVVFVSHLAGRQRLEFDVVLDIRCCHHDSLRTCEFKKDSLEAPKTGRILVLHAFHNTSRV